MSRFSLCIYINTVISISLLVNQTFVDPIFNLSIESTLKEVGSNNGKSFFESIPADKTKGIIYTITSGSHLFVEPINFIWNGLIRR